MLHANLLARWCLCWATGTKVLPCGSWPGGSLCPLHPRVHSSKDGLWRSLISIPCEGWEWKANLARMSSCWLFSSRSWLPCPVVDLYAGWTYWTYWTHYTYCIFYQLMNIKETFKHDWATQDTQSCLNAYIFLLGCSGPQLFFIKIILLMSFIINLILPISVAQLALYYDEIIFA